MRSSGGDCHLSRLCGYIAVDILSEVLWYFLPLQRQARGVGPLQKLTSFDLSSYHVDPGSNPVTTGGDLSHPGDPGTKVSCASQDRDPISVSCQDTNPWGKSQGHLLSGKAVHSHVGGVSSP
ncbi:uncharacterized protein LOC143017660 [Oratosquilla oratoria]|uniref:uncharacterized protein LOC143017660 n=1 Tax=Oratosquilla oratoria TaxID=337810 RepID=UPI003F767B0B